MSLDYLVMSSFRDAAQSDNPSFAGFWPYAISPNGRYVLASALYTLWTLDREDESTVDVSDLASPDGYNGAAIDDDGTIYVIGYTLDGYELKSFADRGTGAATTLLSGLNASTARTLELFVLPDDSRVLVWTENEDSVFHVYTIGGGHTTGATSTEWVTQQIVQDSYGDVWAVGNSTGNIHFKRLVDGGEGTGQTSGAAGIDHSELGIQAYHTSAGWFVCANSGIDLYLIDDSDFTVSVHRSYGSGIGNLLNLPLFDVPAFLKNLAPGAEDFWFPGPESFTRDYFDPPPGYVDVHKINASDLTSIETHAWSDWLIGDEVDTQAGAIYSPYGRPALISNWYGEAIPVIRYLGAGEAGDPTLRVWGYSLDGHDFYCLRLGDSETLVYDLSTGQWASWKSSGQNNWRAIVGQNWIGASAATMARGFGTDVVAGDDTAGVLWILDPSTGRDDNIDTGTSQFTRVVTGGLTLTGRQAVPCGAVTLDLSLGDPAMTGASITLRTSDDQGENWTDHGAVTIAAGETDAVVEWRALGMLRAPGRVFEFSDNGAAVRLNLADMR